MTQQEKNELAVLAKTDERAFEMLLKVYAPLMAREVRRYKKTIYWKDGLQEARLGVWDAVRWYKAKSYFFPMNQIKSRLRAEANRTKKLREKMVVCSGEYFEDKVGKEDELITKKDVVMCWVKDEFKEPIISRYRDWLDDMSLRKIAKAHGVSYEMIRLNVKNVNLYLTKKVAESF